MAAMFQGVKDSGVDHVKLAATERHACDSTAQPDSIVELGSYTFYSAKDEVLDVGKFMVVWNKAGPSGGYKLAYDMFSSNGKL